MFEILLIVMNVLSFSLMGIDKMRAKRGAWRIPEKTLFTVTALFGGLGGVMGMRVFHHKTRHRSFAVGFPALLTIQVIVLAALYGGVI